MWSKIKGIALQLLIYTTAIFIAVLVFQYVSGSLIIRFLIADCVATIFIFGCSAVFKNASLYDPYWSVGPLVIVIGLTLIYLRDISIPEARHLILLIGILIWSMRLTFNFFMGWKGMEHQDWRYDALRQKHKAFYPLVNLFGIHLFPTLLVFLGCLPLFYVFEDFGNMLGMIDYLGIGILIIGILFEMISDRQLRRFKKQHAGTDNVLATGLWSYSRHPNYFGEICFWIGLFVISYGSGIVPLWTAVGFISILLLFWFISIPMIDKRLNRKASYQEITKGISALFPLPPKK